EIPFGAVVDDDRVNGMFGAEIDFPPGVLGVLFGMSLTAVAIVTALVAVDRFAGIAAVGGVLLRRLALASNVAAAAVDLDLGERKRPALSGELDADVTPGHRLAVSRPSYQLLWQAAQQGFNLWIETRLLGEIADHWHGVDQVAQGCHRFGT